MKDNFFWYNLLSFFIIIFIFFLLVFLPAWREKKKKKELLASLKKGDKIILVGGILAKIFEIKDDIIIVEVSPKVRIEVLKSSVLSKRQ